MTAKTSDIVSTALFVFLLIIGVYCAFRVYDDSKTQKAKDYAAEKNRGEAEEHLRTKMRSIGL